jgi:hypothetical protein
MARLLPVKVQLQITTGENNPALSYKAERKQRLKPSKSTRHKSQRGSWACSKRQKQDHPQQHCKTTVDSDCTPFSRAIQ